eukprot:GHVR01078223.1.p1 GENE.GHVR01078223.1~~GHVR01078223.1.p1  ORF type:complete len:474 (+),score=57.01 GHVR01078223.1:29-1423(+)
MSLFTLVVLLISGALLHLYVADAYEYRYEDDGYTIEGIKHNGKITCFDYKIEKKEENKKLYISSDKSLHHERTLFIPAKSTDGSDKHRYVVEYPLTDNDINRISRNIKNKYFLKEDQLKGFLQPVHFEDCDSTILDENSRLQMTYEWGTTSRSGHSVGETIPNNKFNNYYTNDFVSFYVESPKNYLNTSMSRTCQVFKRFHLDLEHIGGHCVYAAYIDNFDKFTYFKQKLYGGLILDGLKALIDLNSDNDGNYRNNRNVFGSFTVVVLDMKLDSWVVDLGYWNIDQTKHVCHYLYDVVTKYNKDAIEDNVIFNNDTMEDNKIPKLYLRSTPELYYDNYPDKNLIPSEFNLKYIDLFKIRPKNYINLFLFAIVMGQLCFGILENCVKGDCTEFVKSMDRSTQTNCFDEETLGIHWNTFIRDEIKKILLYKGDSDTSVYHTFRQWTDLFSQYQNKLTVKFEQINYM